MMELQRHRGPDDQGLRLFSLRTGESTENQVPGPQTMFEGALGFNRLSILDLSAHGHQPMATADGKVFIAFNGEVYNAFSYTNELKAAGFAFRSRTDTEVLLYLYERYGFDGMLERLNGMFTIVIVDLRRREIRIARDHLGIKPFYWTIQGKTFLFASEVKSFLVHPAFEGALEIDNVDEYLAFRYCAGDRHLLRGVQQLRPGHWLRVHDGEVRVHRYWQIPDHSEKARMSRAAVVDRLGQLLRSGVESQLLSDVKVGCQLSGGIDSSLVTHIARTQCQADLDTFSVIVNDSRHSEDAWVSGAAAATLADNHRFMFTRDSFFKYLEDATWHLDQPVNHPNSLGIYLLARQSRKLVTVLLSGEGADELFGGYPRFYHAALRSRLGRLIHLLAFLPVLRPRLADTFGDMAADEAATFIAATQFLSQTRIQEIRPDADNERVFAARRQTFHEGTSDVLSNCLKYEMQTYMVDLLVRQDKMTMAHSLENRVPFLDLPLVQFVRTLPSEHLIRDRVSLKDASARHTKVILKDLARRSFDEGFVYRRKSGFGMPLHDYFRDRRFDDLMHDVLTTMRRRGVLRADIVERHWNDVRAGSTEADEAVWIPVAFEMWARKFLDRPRALAMV